MMAKKKASTRCNAQTPRKTATTPNLYWRSMTMDQLRQEPRCIALAPADAVQQQQLQGTHAYRYVRQDGRLWSELHDGMLTTGRLKAALGMHESAAGAVMGIHPGSRGSGHLLSAYSHLVNTTYSRRGFATSTGNSSNNSDSSSSDSSSSSSAGTPPSSSNKQPGAGAAKATSQQQQQQQQQRLQKQFGGLLPRPVMLQQPARHLHTQTNPSESQQQQQQQQEQQQQQQQQAPQVVTTPAAVVKQLELHRQCYNQTITQQASTAAAAAAGPGSMTWALEQQISAAAIQAAQQHSERAAAGGDMSVKMSWGKTQEASALYCVMNLFPDALLEEVGLFELDTSQLPDSWNVNPQLLPPLGASPDAVLIHRLTLHPDDLHAAAQLLTPTDNMLSSSSNAPHSRRSAADSEAAAVQLLLQRGFERLRCAGFKPQVSGVQYADSSSDGEAAPSSTQGSISSNTSDAGVVGNSSSSSGSSQGDSVFERVGDSVQPHKQHGAGMSSLDSSSSQSRENANSNALDIHQAGSLAFEPVAASVLRVLRDWQQQQQQPVSLVVREAVEVKNHCPFGIRFKRSGKKGRVDLAYHLSPRGCAGSVHPQWIPQLQLHMAATGCESVLLASRCAARGLRVYRVWRDDGYLKEMMHLLQELQASHVLCQVPPRPDSLSRLASHRPFLTKTVSLARGSECVAAVGEAFVACVPANAVNQTQFWTATH